MASGNRASMREGPLAQLFRKTEEEHAEGKPAADEDPKAGRPAGLAAARTRPLGRAADPRTTCPNRRLTSSPS